MAEAVQEASSQVPGLTGTLIGGDTNPVGSFSMHGRPIFHSHRDPEEVCPNRGLYAP